MGRRSGFSGLIAAAARDAARAQRQAEANYRRQLKERERAARQAERASANWRSGPKRSRIGTESSPNGWTNCGRSLSTP